MSTASAVLRRIFTVQRDVFFTVPMSTASAVLRQNSFCFHKINVFGTYVYCFGTGCHPALDAGSSPGTFSGISWIPRRSAE